MAGRDQHYIPRLLMRGFKIPGVEGEKVFCFEKNQPPARPRSTRSIGSTEDFYSGPADNALDKSITDAETKNFGPAIHRARTGQSLRDDDPLQLRRFFVHMIVRTDSVRSIQGEIVKSVIEGMHAAISTPEVFARAIHNELVDFKRIVADAIDEQRSKGFVCTNEERARVAELFSVSVTSDAGGIGRELVGLLRKAMPSAPPIAVAAGAMIQKKVLSAEIAPPLKVSDLQAYDLSVEPMPSNLILSDDPVLAFNDDAEPQRAMFPDQRPSLYMLPVAPQRAIVLRDGLRTLPSVHALNRQSAAQSHHFFIAQAVDAELSALVSTIGTFKSVTETMDWASHFIENVPTTD